MEYVIFGYEPYEGYSLDFEGDRDQCREYLEKQQKRATKGRPFYSDDYEIYEKTSLSVSDLVKRDHTKHCY